MILAKIPQTAAVGLFALIFMALPAQALPLRTFVSALGNDTGTCTRIAPCQTFAYAITQTSPGGEIDVLSAGDYGKVNIAQAVSIVQDGAGEAGVPGVAFFSSITINAGANDAIYLRGLTLDGLGTNNGNGIEFDSGGSLQIEKCVIRNFGGEGILFTPAASSTLTVTNTVLAGNGVGINVHSAGSDVITAVLRRVVMAGNGNGLIAENVAGSGKINVTVEDSVASDSTQNGVTAFSTSAAEPANILLRGVIASNNANVGALAQQAGATILLADSTVTGNNGGVWAASGGSIQSYGDNDIDGNHNDVIGTLGSVTQQ